MDKVCGVCDVCGMVEPPVWSEQPMNESIRAYARQYCTPPIIYHETFQDALDEWGITME